MSLSDTQLQRVSEVLAQFPDPAPRRQSNTQLILIWIACLLVPGVGLLATFLLMHRTPWNVAFAGLAWFPFMLVALLVAAQQSSRSGLEDVMDILAKFPGPVAVPRAKSLQTTGFVIAAIVVIVAGAVYDAATYIWLIRHVGRTAALLACGLIIIGLALALPFLYRFFRTRPPVLTLDGQGFALRQPKGGETRRRWDQVSDFKTFLDLVRFSDASQPDFWDVWRAGRGRGHLPGTFLRPKLLSRLMVTWQELALTAAEGPREFRA
jgi:hypothetical protein